MWFCQVYVRRAKLLSADIANRWEKVEMEIASATKRPLPLLNADFRDWRHDLFEGFLVIFTLVNGISTFPRCVPLKKYGPNPPLALSSRTSKASESLMVVDVLSRINPSTTDPSKFSERSFCFSVTLFKQMRPQLPDSTARVSSRASPRSSRPTSRKGKDSSP